MPFYLSQKSTQVLETVHPDLQRVIRKAITLSEVDFSVIEGARTKERQRALFAAGASSTLKSRHLTGHAVDLAAWVDGRTDWSWPLYEKIARTVKIAANSLDINVEWGGDWQSFKDGPHFQLSWTDYPAND